MSGRKDRKTPDQKQLFAWAALMIVVVWLAANRPTAVDTTGETRNQPVTTESVEASPAEGAGGDRVEVIAELLNFRAEPNGEKKNIIGTLRKGLVVDVLEKSPGWLKVEAPDGRIGFIADQGKYIKFLEE